MTDVSRSEQDFDPLDPFELLKNGWIKPEMPPRWLQTMTLGLMEIPGEELHAALMHLIRTSDWRPNSPAVVRRAVVELRGLFPSAAEAGRVAKEYARKVDRVRSGGPQPRYPIVHPVIADAVEAAGVAHEASFIKAYREAVDRHISQIIAEPLDQPVVFRPAPIPGADRTPPDYRWERGGWRTPAGELVHADSGDQPAIHAVEQPALLAAPS